MEHPRTTAYVRNAVPDYQIKSWLEQPDGLNSDTGCGSQFGDCRPDLGFIRICRAFGAFGEQLVQSACAIGERVKAGGCDLNSTQQASHCHGVVITVIATDLVSRHVGRQRRLTQAQPFK